MKFTLEITLGNAAMQTGVSLAETLREVADTMEEAFYDEPIGEECSGKIRDANSNRVGVWEVTP